MSPRIEAATAREFEDWQRSWHGPYIRGVSQKAATPWRRRLIGTWNNPG